MPVVGTPRTFHKKFAFVVEIEGVASAAFTKMSELSAEVAVVEQWEGGSITPDKDPGRVTTPPCTLERGVASGDSDLYAWWLDVVRMSANSGLPSPAFKRQVEPVQLQRDGSVLRRWVLDEAWPSKIVVGDWDNTADENVMESAVITFRTFDKVFG